MRKAKKEKKSGGQIRLHQKYVTIKDARHLAWAGVLREEMLISACGLDFTGREF